MDSVYTLVFVYTFYRIQRLVWCIVNRIVSYAIRIRVRYVSRGNVHALEPMRSNRNRPKVSERAKGPWPEMQR